MKYYLTTPLYYVNAAPHLGHTYSTMAADLIRRFKHMQGYDAVMFTGTDEHGQKVERASKSAGFAPEEYTTRVANEFRRQWDLFGLKVDRWIRTSNPKHHETVRWLFQRCVDNGYVYKGSYTGQYCANCELYVNEAKPGDPCPDCGRPTETVTEENYFFKLSAFQQKLLDFYEQNPKWIQPDARRNEVISFVKGGLNDLSITRTSIKWGIPVPVEGKHVFYVWFDALIGYMSAVAGENLWPADLHLIGKEILRFHAVYWPAFLMAGEVPLPKRIYAHGWLLIQESKMSKSRGNMVRAEPLKEVVGADAIRYFLMREIVFGQDGNFSYDALIDRYNSDLANGLGNLASRTLTMIKQYRQGLIPQGGESPISDVAGATIAAAIEAFDNFEFSRGLEQVWSMLGAVDKYIVEQAPWKLVKQADAQDQLSTTLYTAAEALRIATVLLYPVIPDSAEKIWGQLGMTSKLEDVQLSGLAWGQLEAGQKIGEISGVFPRIDVKEAVEKIKELEAKASAAQALLLGKAPAAAPATAAAESDGKIPIDDFVKVDMRVGVVLSAERVKGADKLLHLKVDIGEPEPRTIVAGIAEAYDPAVLLGRKVVIVANLQPRKLRGLTSQGMIVAASLEGGKPVLAGFLEDVPVGARLK
jgi:methionyl-tRNA synthetase